MSVKYFVRKHKTKTNIQVCRAAFIGILRIIPNRLKGVLARYWKSGCIATENRGGDRKETDVCSTCLQLQEQIKFEKGQLKSKNISFAFQLSL
ncbi:unnamed protein product [Pieris macdunnoughi]|uniref:Uncharacterized protein n=1 Tax=Pieris macdunnoughi TaxID=345717 RepID=A0A821XM48_9NEOP|nr:unnamed protein product [Pieris macdunnoughi]